MLLGLRQTYLTNNQQNYNVIIINIRFCDFRKVTPMFFLDYRIGLIIAQNSMVCCLKQPNLVSTFLG